MDNISKFTNLSSALNNTCPNDGTVEIKERQKIVTLSTCAVFSLGAITLNIILMTKINRKSKQKEFTRYFLTSMAAVDLFVGLTVMPFSIANEFIDLRIFLGSRICYLMNSLDVMLSSASIIHLSFLTFDRYVALCRPFSYVRICNRRNMILLSLLCWTVVATVSFGFIMPGIHHLGIGDTFLQCTVHSADRCIFVVNLPYDMVSSTLTFFIPAFFIIYCNVKLSKHVRHQSMKRKYMLNGSSRHAGRGGNNSKSMRIAKTIAALTVCFFICWLPFFITCKIEIFTSYKIPHIVWTVVLWLGYANSAMNPLLYLMLEHRMCV